MIYNYINKKNVINILYDIRDLLYPGLYKKINHSIDSFILSKKKKIKRKIYNFLLEINDYKNLKFDFNNIDILINELDKIKKLLILDLEAFILNDPSINDKYEVLLANTSYFAIFCYRVANLFYNLDFIYIPYIISNYAHEKTGIDINPKARIGRSFFIDHGTGVVIGETSIIGNNVKIYQGVILGALKIDDVKKLKKIKRHPTILNNVILYANCIILGGNTVIGNNAIVGCNKIVKNSISDWSVI